jgi:hypothetical protein
VSERHGVYVVIGNREYRGIKPGEEFVARLDRGAEQRARHRGDIKFLRHINPTIEARHLRFPDGWLPANPDPQSDEAPEGASLVEEGS